MKRLGIYVIYDREGIIDQYVELVLNELRQYVTSLIVVCNFQAITRGEEFVNCADRIVLRGNKGFDAGAYRDVFIELMNTGEYDSLDEVLLANDSFYGPIHSFERSFRIMENEDCGFWGFSRFPGGSYKGRAIDTHIQSYFLCFKTQVLKYDGFKQFWMDLEYPKDFISAVFQFEFALNRLLSESGFQGKSLMDVCDKSPSVKREENPYMKYALELIRDVEIPVLKRKALSIENDGFENALKALMFIRENTNYDISNICNHLMRVSGLPGETPSYNLLSLKSFCHSYSELLIYGAGKWGKNLAHLLNYWGIYPSGFVVSKKSGNEGDIVLEYQELRSYKQCGIIIGIKKKEDIKMIQRKLLEIYPEKQVFAPTISD